MYGNVSCPPFCKKLHHPSCFFFSSNRELRKTTKHVANLPLLSGKYHYPKITYIDVHLSTFQFLIISRSRGYYYFFCLTIRTFIKTKKQNTRKQLETETNCNSRKGKSGWFSRSKIEKQRALVINILTPLFFKLASSDEKTKCKSERVNEVEISLFLFSF